MNVVAVSSSERFGSFLVRWTRTGACLPAIIVRIAGATDW